VCERESDGVYAAREVIVILRRRHRRVGRRSFLPLQGLQAGARELVSSGNLHPCVYPFFAITLISIVSLSLVPVS
jgi:hypothetical protein